MSLRSRAIRLVRRPAGPTARPAPVACLAPFSSMYLDPRGFVRACCMNDYQLLGNVADRRLVDIWHGPEAQELRRAMERDDLSIGCEFCKWQVDEGHPELAFSRWFTHLRHDGPEPDWPQQLELALSNTCNLQCAMCNAEWSSSIRTQRDGLAPLPKVYDDRFFDDLEAFLPHLTKIKFLGGEPFLASEALRVMDQLIAGGHPARVHLTTNGTQWTPRVERIIASLPVEVAVSLDAATAETYEQIRIGSSWEVVTTNLRRFIEACEGVTVTFCLMRTNWHEFGAFCQLADDLGIGCAVNVVTDPAHLSPFHAPLDALEEIVAGLDAEDARIRDRLTLSRPTWDGELDKLRRHLVATRAGTAVTGVHVRRLNEEFPRPFAERPVVQGARVDEARAALDAALASLDSPVVATLQLDGAERIDGVEVHADILGVGPIDDLAGSPIGDLLERVQEVHGELQGVDPLEVAAHVEVLRARFADGLALRVVMGPRFDGDDLVGGRTLRLLVDAAPT